MAGARRPGPSGIGEDDLSGQKPLLSSRAGFGQASPIGTKEAGGGGARGWHRPQAGAQTSAFTVGAIRYRLIRADGASGQGTDEEPVPAENAAELVAAAPSLTFRGLTAATLVHQVRRGEVVLLRSRPLSLFVTPGPPAVEPSPPPTRSQKPVKDGWIQIEVKDDFGRTRAGDTYTLELPDGRVLSGTLAANGVISLHGIEPGTAKLTFTKIDGSSWS